MAAHSIVLEPLGTCASGAEENRTSLNEVLAALFGRLAGGDVEALGTVYDRCGAEIHALALWRTGSGADAADVVQEVFVRLAAAGAQLLEVRNPRRYLLAMAHRAAVDGMRKRRRMEPLVEASLLVGPPHDPARGLDAERASRLLLLLPPQQREAIYLRHFSDLGFREIGRVTGVPTFTAASRYRLGMWRLRRLMGGPS